MGPEPRTTKNSWREADVLVEGEGAGFTRIGDNDGAATQVFCEKCGATLYHHNSAVPAIISVRVGAFADSLSAAGRLGLSRRHPQARVDQNRDEPSGRTVKDGMQKLPCL